MEAGTGPRDNGASRMCTGRWRRLRACDRITGVRGPCPIGADSSSRVGGDASWSQGQRQMVWPRKAPTHLCAPAQLRPRPQAGALTQQNEAARPDRGGGNTGVARTVSSSWVCLDGVVTTHGRKETSRGKLRAPTALSCPCLWPRPPPTPSPRGGQQGALGALQHPMGEATVSGGSWAAATLPSPQDSPDHSYQTAMPGAETSRTFSHL